MRAAAPHTWRRLAFAINAACMARGDDDANRAALLEEAEQLPLDVQRGLAEHFELVYVGLRPAASADRGSLLHQPDTGDSIRVLRLFDDAPKGVK